MNVLKMENTTFSILKEPSYPLSPNELHILDLGLMFCPDQQIDIFKMIKDPHLFARWLMFKVIYN